MRVGGSEGWRVGCEEAGGRERPPGIVAARCRGVGRA